MDASHAPVRPYFFQLMKERALELLARYYGYHSFRPGQYEIIQAAASGRDTVVIMPTGGGKSLCYQLPALLFPGKVAVVVSPLIALMQDQTLNLVSNGIAAAAMHSGQPEGLNQDIFARASRGELSLLYISPERLLADIESFKQLPVSLFAIDEAHCISQWGHDFRPDYVELAAVKQHFPSVPVLALTATADRLTRDDIIQRLGLHDPFCYLSSFDRPNISLRVISGSSLRSRVLFVKETAGRYPQDSGIVYCLSRKGTEEMAKSLKANGVECVIYHAGMTSTQRDASLNAFLSGRVRVVCATVAFGMGIDKSNIRWVIHANMPGNIESYYQEIGRAGRDGLPAEAVLFFNIQDVIMRRKFAQDSGQPEINLRKLERMTAYAQARVCRRRILLSYFSEERTCDCGNCDNCRRPPQRFDGTIIAQKALSAVMRTGQSIGINLLIGILRGSQRYDIRNMGYDHLPTFGVGADLMQEEWADYINQLIQLGLLEIAYDKGNKLTVTPYGMRVLRGQEKLTLSRYVEESTSRRKKPEQPAIVLDPTEQLISQLKAVRSDIARRDNVPPYVVFSDATLHDMAVRKPTDLESFLQVNGVGEVKAVKYGRRFITAIRDFEGLGKGQMKGTSLRETLVLFNAGMTASEIAQTKGVKIDTIHGHFAELIDKDIITTYHTLISSSAYNDIKNTLAARPETAYEELRERHAPGIIRIAQAIIRAVDRKKR